MSEGERKKEEQEELTSLNSERMILADLMILTQHEEADTPTVHGCCCDGEPD